MKLAFLAIDVDYGNTQSLLRALSDNKLALRAANEAARKYKSEMKTYIRDGKSYTPKTGGTLERSIKWKTEPDGAVVYTRATHGVWIEQGTGSRRIGFAWGLYDIRNRKLSGKKALTVNFHGRLLLLKHVRHPGMHPRPFFFAELESRQEKMLESVIASIRSQAGLT
jgi:hypothetical protein